MSKALWHYITHRAEFHEKARKILNDRKPTNNKENTVNTRSTAYASIWAIIFCVLALVALFTNGSDEAVFSFTVLSSVWGAAGWIVRTLR